MKIIRNNLIPFPGFKAINLFGVLFVRGNAKIDDVTLNHEEIHTAQFVELMLLFFTVSLLFVAVIWWLFLLSPLFFYAWYSAEWLIHFARTGSSYMAYRRISFEREAYTNQGNPNYSNNRDFFNFLKYIK